MIQELTEISYFLVHGTSHLINDIKISRKYKISTDSADLFCTTNPRNWRKVQYIFLTLIYAKIKVNTLAEILEVEVEVWSERESKVYTHFVD